MRKVCLNTVLQLFSRCLVHQLKTVHTLCANNNVLGVQTSVMICYASRVLRHQVRYR